MLFHFKQPKLEQERADLSLNKQTIHNKKSSCLYAVGRLLNGTIFSFMVCMEERNGAQEKKQTGADLIISEYENYINTKTFVCVAAKAALAKQQISSMVAGHIACPKDDMEILRFLYSFVDTYRASEGLYHSAAVIFEQPQILNEETFDDLLWQRLQSLANLDAQQYSYDKRVSNDPASPAFSFSLKEEAFFVIGLHPANSRTVRQFKYPTIVFNPHAQFEQLKDIEKYQQLKKVVRKRDLAVSGSVNPMLQDFGEASEVYQYSGRQYNNDWKCPLMIPHANNRNHSAA